MTHTPIHPDSLLAEIRTLIEDARLQVAHAANAGLTIAYWRIGKRSARKFDRWPGRVRPEDSCITGTTIGARIWQGLQLFSPNTDGPICRTVLRRENTCITDTRIDVDSFHCAIASERPART